MKRVLFSGWKSKILFDSGGITPIHSLPYNNRNILCKYDTYKINNYYIGVSLILCDDIPIEDINKWSLATGHSRWYGDKYPWNFYNGWMPKYYFYNTTHDKDTFETCKDDEIISVISSNYDNINDLVSKNDPNIGVLFKYTSDINKEIIFSKRSIYELFINSYDGPLYQE